MNQLFPYSTRISTYLNKQNPAFIQVDFCFPDQNKLECAHKPWFALAQISQGCSPPGLLYSNLVSPFISVHSVHYRKP